MKDFLKNSLFNCLLPWAFICFQYNQCHGYFAESYEVLLAFLGLIWFINIFLSFIKLPTNFIVSLWVVLILPNLSGSLTNAYKFKDYRKGYIKQLQGLNKKVLELIKLICQKDPHGIIILQGDHGTFTTDDLREHQSFLFAIKTNIAYKCLQTEQFFKQFIYE